ncbi:hypothetical protein LOC67_01460 [Stieleria sp. JC731]|uniref:hypothetical protein n=1 Tax=Pirellulaceae TaxID=2691357 RepID=UPI001E603380|nr:hypothetical protein [Stieleria sp. JC731]MCC9599210.1 hypothetical protein [Stieleria sp. JC731]
MKLNLTRRKFATVSGSFIAGTAINQPNILRAETSEIRQMRLVELGLNALARSPQMNYFADGHRGAAMISAHLMCVDNQFDDATANRINELFELNWANSKLCNAFPEGDRIEDACDQVGKALSEGSGTLREVGHDAIFAMHAIKAFRMMPQLATKERVDGVCQLLRSIKPWRDIDPDPEIDPPAFSDQAAAASFVLKEASDAIDRFVGFGQGFAGHMLTFGQSLIEMAAMGDVEWAENCRVAFCKYVTVTRQGPQEGDRKIKDHQFSKLRPEDREYWQRRGNKTLGIGHVFKYPYAYYDLIARANDPELEKSFDDKAWQLF